MEKYPKFRNASYWGQYNDALLESALTERKRKFIEYLEIKKALKMNKRKRRECKIKADKERAKILKLSEK